MGPCAPGVGAGRAAAMVSLAARLGFLIGPVAIGAAAELVGLRTALAGVAVVAVALAAAAPKVIVPVSPRPDTPGPDTARPVRQARVTET